VQVIDAKTKSMK